MGGKTELCRFTQGEKRGGFVRLAERRKSCTSRAVRLRIRHLLARPFE